MDRQSYVAYNCNYRYLVS